MGELISFHGDPAVKAKYLARVEAHAAADRLVQGTGWENGKGCAIGCTLEAYDHSRYPIELGLPEWLAHLEDSIFENLPKADAMTWPARFLAAIPVGVDVENVRYQLTIRRMDRLLLIVDAEQFPDVVAAIHMVRRCSEAEIGDGICDWSAAGSAARSAAEAAAWSAAWSAARSAAWSTWQQEASDLLELLSEC